MITNEILMKALNDLIDEKMLAIDGLTRDQFAECLRQAILAGDFQKHVVVSSNAQQVIYIPYHDQERLKARIAELEQKVEDMDPGFTGEISQ